LPGTVIIAGCDDAECSAEIAARRARGELRDVAEVVFQDYLAHYRRRLFDCRLVGERWLRVRITMEASSPVLGARLKGRLWSLNF
jgi:hypothetical protein